MAFYIVFSSGWNFFQQVRYHEINNFLPCCLHFRSGKILPKTVDGNHIGCNLFFKDLSLCQRLSVMQTIKGCKMFCRQNFQVEPLCEGPGTLKTYSRNNRRYWTWVHRQILRRSWPWSVNEPWFDPLLRVHVFTIGRRMWSSIWLKTFFRKIKSLSVLYHSKINGFARCYTVSGFFCKYRTYRIR